MKHISLGSGMLNALQRNYTITKNDIGADADLKAKGIHLMTESWEIQDLGHLCIMRMNAFFGLMKMETVVLSVTEKDVPLFNLDWMKVFSKETQIAELYDTQLSPWQKEAQAEFDAIKEKDNDIEDYIPEGRWFDDLLYSCSYAKTAAGKSSRLYTSANAYAETFVRQLAGARNCADNEKAEKNAQFANQLIASGGPAVNMIIKLFGQQTARRLILRHMYGVDR